jgi:hypothetical protein
MRWVTAMPNPPYELGLELRLVRIAHPTLANQSNCDRDNKATP